jgi:LysM repeat protein
MAEAVVRAWPGLSRGGSEETATAEAPGVSEPAATLRRQADPGEPQLEEEDPEAESFDESGQPKREPGKAPVSSARLDLPRGGGRPLDRALRTPLQNSFGHDFGGVRIHTGDRAAAAARQVSAQAFTVGSDVYFGRGHYRPGSQSGLRLLAHEMTHVVQQSPHAGGTSSLRRRPLPESPLGELPQEQRPLGIQRKTNRKSCDGECPGASGQPIWTPLPVEDDDGKETLGKNEKCPASGAKDSSNFIRKLNVRRSDYETDLEWGPADFKKPATKVETIPCSPNLTATPTDNDLIGAKCTACHTNKKGSGMGWFTGFQKTYLRIGFHNSQTVAKGVQSAGCVRVSCAHAEMINKNTATSLSKITVDKPKLTGPSSPPPTSGPARPQKGAFEYEVEKGDTVGKLSERFGVTEDAIAKANGLEDPNSIHEGQKLTIPAVEGAEAKPKPEEKAPEAPKEEKKEEEEPGRPTKKAFQYTVKKDDKVGVLAERFGVSVDSIVKANKLENPNMIREGQTLTIPEEGS